MLCCLIAIIRHSSSGISGIIVEMLLYYMRGRDNLLIKIKEEGGTQFTLCSYIRLEKESFILLRGERKEENAREIYALTSATARLYGTG